LKRTEETVTNHTGLLGLLTRHQAPQLRSRIVVAIGIGVYGVLLSYGFHLAHPNHPGDFGLSWFGARAIIEGRNPYALVGPGLEYNWPWPLVYPGTAFVVALPLAWLPLLPAVFAFVFISSALLAYAITSDGWFRLPMFGSAAYIVAAGAAQWSPLFTAAIGIPLVASLFAAKPTIGLALAAAGSRRVQYSAAAGSLVLLSLSLILFPSWPMLWIRQLSYATQMAPPFLRFGGPFTLLALLRWRRPEARLILMMAFVPQVGSWYEALPLFLVPATYREMMSLSSFTLVAFLLQGPVAKGMSETQFNDFVGSLMIAAVYLPAVIMVLRRPNESKPLNEIYRAASPSKYV
jgi:hypothetical protein